MACIGAMRIERENTKCQVLNMGVVHGICYHLSRSQVLFLPSDARGEQLLGPKPISLMH